MGTFCILSLPPYVQVFFWSPYKSERKLVMRSEFGNFDFSRTSVDYRGGWNNLRWGGFLAGMGCMVPVFAGHFQYIGSTALESL